MINLLPLEEKKIIFSKKRKRIVKILWFLFFFFLICLTINLFLVNYYLEKEIDFYREKFSVLDKEKENLEIKEIQDRIIEINSLLTTLNNFYEGKVYFSNIFRKIDEKLPSNIYLTNISISKRIEDGKEKIKVSISGFSPRREDLLRFKEDIEEDNYFKEVYFPSSTWVSSLDINFSLNFDIYDD